MAGVPIEHDTWVMVGDGERALFLRNEGDANLPNLQVIEALSQDNPASHDQGTDRPGRTRSSVAMRKSALGDTDWHQLEKHRFAKVIAEALHQAAEAGLYQKLVIVAPPATLGDLRKSLHPTVAGRVVAEIDKTLTGMPPYRIEEALARLH